MPSSRAPPASHRSPPAPATPSASGSTRAATARSTLRYTASSSPAPAATNPPATTSPDDAAKARAPAKRSAASSATSPATSGDCCNRPTRSRRSYPHQFLDIEATEAMLRTRPDRWERGARQALLPSGDAVAEVELIGEIPNAVASVVPDPSAVHRIKVGKRLHIGRPLENATTNGCGLGLMRQPPREAALH